MAYGHKTQSFIKNGGQQECLDLALGGEEGTFFAKMRGWLKKGVPDVKLIQLHFNYLLNWN